MTLATRYEEDDSVEGILNAENNGARNYELLRLVFLDLLTKHEYHNGKQIIKLKINKKVTQFNIIFV